MQPEQLLADRWIGGADSDFLNGSNWSHGYAPTASSNALLTGAGVDITLNIGGEVDLGRLREEAGFSLAIRGGANLHLASAGEPISSLAGAVHLYSSRLSGEPITMERDGSIVGTGTITSDLVVSGRLQAGDGDVLTLSGQVDLSGSLTGSGRAVVADQLILERDATVEIGELRIDGELSVQASTTITGYADLYGFVNLNSGKLTLTGHTDLDAAQINSKSGSLVNQGSMTQHGTSSINAAFTNNGNVDLINSSLIVDGVHGTGTFSVPYASTLQFNSDVSSGTTVRLLSGHLVLEDAFDFRGHISDFSSGGSSIDLAYVADEGETLRWRPDAVGSGGVLRIYSGGHTIALHLDGSYSASQFQHHDDGNGGSIITYNTQV